MKPALRDLSTAHLAFVTGHKLINIHRANAGPLLGQIYLGQLDGGKLERLKDIRKRLETQYLEAEARQDKPVEFR